MTPVLRLFTSLRAGVDTVNRNSEEEWRVGSGPSKTGVSDLKAATTLRRQDSIGGHRVPAQDGLV